MAKSKKVPLKLEEDFVEVHARISALNKRLSELKEQLDPFFEEGREFSLLTPFQAQRQIIPWREEAEAIALKYMTAKEHKLWAKRIQKWPTTECAVSYRVKEGTSDETP